ncbi:MAG: DUF5753 domain-containing protein, partial [Pseudonocardiaceae bacterium]
TQAFVPGMLQTAAYARATCRWQHLSESEQERFVTARLTRGSRLREEGFTLDTIIEEAVLHRASHMGGVGREQLAHLREAMTLPSVTVNVLPFTVGIHQSMSGSFTVLTFPRSILDPIGYQSFGESIVLV